jgi:hypothetical protein
MRKAPEMCSHSVPFRTQFMAMLAELAPYLRSSFTETQVSFAQFPWFSSNQRCDDTKSGTLWRRSGNSRDPAVINTIHIQGSAPPTLPPPPRGRYPTSHKPCPLVCTNSENFAVNRRTDCKPEPVCLHSRSDPKCEVSYDKKQSQPAG